MNRRVLFIGIGVAALMAIISLVAWMFLSSSSNEQVIDPTPLPTESAGVLPITSSSPIPISSPSAAPVAFTSVCSDTWASQTDTDLDSLPDSVEATYGTDINKQDTDNDGYSDGEEARAGYNPASARANVRLDSDNDGLLDNEECIWGTDPFTPDSDNDGFMDGAEVKNGFDPSRKGDGKGSDKILIATPEPTPPLVDLSQPTPTPKPGSTVVPIQIQSSSQGNAKLSLVPVAQLKITSATAPADVKAYLAQIDLLRPEEFSDGQLIANAIQSAGNGDVKPLSQVRTRIAQFAADLKGVSTPKPAQEYQQLYVSLIDFTVQKLQIIEQNATGNNQQLAVQAVVDIQNLLPTHLVRLSQLRQTVEGISNK